MQNWVIHVGRTCQFNISGGIYGGRLLGVNQNMSGGIYGSIHIQLNSIIGGRENILFSKGFYVKLITKDFYKDKKNSF